MTLRWGLALVVGLCLLTSDAVLGQERRPGKIQESEKSLERIRQELEELEGRKKAAGQEERSILRNLEVSDRQLQARRREIPDIQAKIRQRDREIEGVERQLELLRESVAHQRGRVEQRLRSIYMQGQTPYAKILFQADGYQDFMRQYSYLMRISRKEAELLGRFEASVREMEKKRSDLDALKGGLVTYRGELERKVQQIRREKRAKDRMLAKIRTEQKTYEQTIGELESSSQELQSLIKRLKRKREAMQKKDGSTRPLPGGFAKSRGRLNWPVSGRLLSPFGLQKHPKFDSYIYRKGIEISAKQGQAIRAVYAGEVVYADWFPAYGMVVILDHGENYYTLYAHLARILVSMADRVDGDQLIGETGDTGMTEGDRLYFELRKGEKPIDPLTWLKANR